MSHLTYAEAGFVGLLQGITELFPVSSLGHAVLIPAVVGGQWAQDLNVSEAESPYLAYIVGLHVATATAMIIYFWRDWLRIVKGFFASIGHMIAPAPGTHEDNMKPGFGISGPGYYVWWSWGPPAGPAGVGTNVFVEPAPLLVPPQWSRFCG